ncbi:hypothetical protein [Qipengyuania sp. JC766]|uniref:hypothetical protein n=1 Tax=Qipengyuania sp. JC766 TaxID=3232139 RepID=UPI00345A3F4A
MIRAALPPFAARLAERARRIAVASARRAKRARRPDDWRNPRALWPDIFDGDD